MPSGKGGIFARNQGSAKFTGTSLAYYDDEFVGWDLYGKRKRGFMIIYEDKLLEGYKLEHLQIQPDWKRRDFTARVRRYLEGVTEKVLAVGGLRGTGKTVGILQASEGLDVAYVLVQENEEEKGSDYIDFLRNTEKKYVLIDEYSWIKDREALDRYLLTAVQNGKRVVITGTESITLDFLNYGALIHRVDMIHTTMFPYEEYRRIYGLDHSQRVCDDYLLNGGVFKDYAITNFSSMKEYVESAIVKNLAGYLQEEMDEEMARTLTYSVLFKAVCPSNLSNVPVLRDSKVMLDNFLDTMGVNTGIEIPDQKLYRVADIFEQAGIIVQVQNYDRNSSLKEQYYITNPSLTCQLIRAAYGLETIPETVLGHVFEACAMVQLSTNKLSEHEIFFLNSEGQSGVDARELDIVITDKEEEHVYFFECKHMQNHKIRSSATILTGHIENTYFQHSDVDGRYVIYNGEPCVKKYEVGEVMFTPLGEVVNNYFAFEENTRGILRVEVFEHERTKDRQMRLDEDFGHSR